MFSNGCLIQKSIIHDAYHITGASHYFFSADSNHRADTKPFVWLVLIDQVPDIGSVEEHWSRFPELDQIKTSQTKGSGFWYPNKCLGTIEKLDNTSYNNETIKVSGVNMYKEGI